MSPVIKYLSDLSSLRDQGAKIERSKRMKKGILGYVVVVAVLFLFTSSAFAQDAQKYKIGVGYQGLFFGNTINGLSVRSWLGPNTAIGLEGNIFYGNAEVDIDGATDDADADLYMLELKAMYAFIVRTNSRFYAGGKFGYGRLDVDIDASDAKVDAYVPAVFVGAEWNFPQLPELGFNFEVGYSYAILEGNDVLDGTDLDLSGINVGMGIKYYF